MVYCISPGDNRYFDFVVWVFFFFPPRLLSIIEMKDHEE